MLKVLFVCSSPVMYRSEHSSDYEDLDEMKEELPIDIYNYIIDNGLIKYEDDDDEKEEKYPYFLRRDLPDEYIRRMIEPEIYYRDLDKYREYIIDNIKHLYPTVKFVEYVTVDPITLDPKVFGDETIMNLIQEQDHKYYDTYGVDMKFLDHHTMTFQEYINITNDVFDVVWFLRCSDFSNVIDISDTYWTKFKRILDKDGIIVHADGTEVKVINPETGENQVVMEFVPIDDRYSLLPAGHSENQDKIDWFLDNVVQVKTGVYKFKPQSKISREKLVSMLLM